jgi:hypothetical protein
LIATVSQHFLLNSADLEKIVVNDEKQFLFIVLNTPENYLVPDMRLSGEYLNRLHGLMA